MSTLSRRHVIRTGMAATAGLFSPSIRETQTYETGRIPLFHTTDLYHPPQDPDDQLDLLTILCLPEFDLKGVGLDVTRKFLDGSFDTPRDPGYVPVSQLAHRIGKGIPTGTGPMDPLASETDDCLERSIPEQGAIRLLLEVLAESAEPVVITICGSARIVTAAFNRAPALMRARTRAVILNAGSTGGPKPEWNVMLDPHAFRGLWNSGLPIHWYPCSTETGAFSRSAERGTYWSAQHADLFHEIPQPLKAWIHYGFSGQQRGDIIRAMEEMGRGSGWENVLAGQRNLWSTASLVQAAGRELYKSGDGWRFLPVGEAESLEKWPWRLDPITANANDVKENNVSVIWEPGRSQTPYTLFGRKPGPEFGTAMAEALNALFRTFPG